MKYWKLKNKTKKKVKIEKERFLIAIPGFINQKPVIILSLCNIRIDFESLGFREARDEESIEV